jgi:putative ABC transport system permease protein
MFDILDIASRNLLRYRRRSMLRLLLIVIGMVAVLLFIAVAGSFKAMMVGQMQPRSAYSGNFLAVWTRSTR